MFVNKPTILTEKNISKSMYDIFEGEGQTSKGELKNSRIGRLRLMPRKTHDSLSKNPREGSDKIVC